MDTIDATCPLVAKVHAEARRFAAEGNLVVLIGHAGHEEVDGTLGEAPGSMVLVQSSADVAALQPPDPRKVVYLMQTTLSADEAGEIVATLLATRFPGPRSRQRRPPLRHLEPAARGPRAAGRRLRPGAGGRVGQLLQTLCGFGGDRAACWSTTAYLIDGPSDIELSWLAGVSTIGLTAGASAPPELVVQEIVTALRLASAPIEVSASE